jgi:hypothetical protein
MRIGPSPSWFESFQLGDGASISVTLHPFPQCLHCVCARARVSVSVSVSLYVCVFVCVCVFLDGGYMMDKDATDPHHRLPLPSTLHPTPYAPCPKS